MKFSLERVDEPTKRHSVEPRTDDDDGYEEEAQRFEEVLARGPLPRRSASSRDSWRPFIIRKGFILGFGRSCPPPGVSRAFPNRFLGFLTALGIRLTNVRSNVHRRLTRPSTLWRILSTGRTVHFADSSPLEEYLELVQIWPLRPFGFRSDADRCFRGCCFLSSGRPDHAYLLMTTVTADVRAFVGNFEAQDWAWCTCEV